MARASSRLRQSQSGRHACGGAVQKRAVVSAIAAVGVLATPARADVVSDGNEKVVILLTNARMAPPQAERVMAMVHVAMFDAVNAIDTRYRRYLIQPEAQATASKEAAAATAAGKVLLGLYPQGEVELKATLAAYLSTLPAGEAKVEG